MSRYNIFFNIHKGLKALLFETALQLQQTDFDTDDANKVLQHLQVLIDLFDRHAHTEDTFILPAIAKANPHLIQAFEEEHHQDVELGLQLRQQITACVAAASSTEKISIGCKLIQSYNNFMLFNITHMTKEESLLNKALWELYTDLELHGITQQIVTAVPAQLMALYSNYMMRGMSNREIIEWLKEIKNNAPDLAFRSLIATAEAQLSSIRWQQIQESITEGAMLA